MRLQAAVLLKKYPKVIYEVFNNHALAVGEGKFDALSEKLLGMGVGKFGRVHTQAPREVKRDGTSVPVIIKGGIGKFVRIPAF